VDALEKELAAQGAHTVSPVAEQGEDGNEPAVQLEQAAHGEEEPLGRKEPAAHADPDAAQMSVVAFHA
jgi:hypothetical protein